MRIKNKLIFFLVILLSSGCADYKRYQESQKFRQRIAQHQAEIKEKALAEGRGPSTNESLCMREWLPKVDAEMSSINRKLGEYESPVTRAMVAASHCQQLESQRYINSKALPEAESLARKNNCPAPTRETTIMHQDYDNNDKISKEYLVYTDDAPQQCAWKPAPAYQVVYQPPTPKSHVRKIDCNRPARGWEELTCLGSKYDLDFSSPWH